MMTGNDMMTGDDMMDMVKMMDSTMYMSWAHVMLPAPGPMEAATSPAETGAAHNPPPIDGGVLTPRTVYINDIGAMANKAGAAAYPAGTVIVKEIMDKTETFVDKVAVMMKSDDPMYAGHDGWAYKKYLRPSADAAYMQIRGSNLEDAGNGCHGCHANATNDSVFVSLSMDDMMGGMDDMKGMEDGDMEGMESAEDAGDAGMNGMGDDADAGTAQ
ncbi:MAG: cytochrome P460 family protein [Candidatus Poribacteria bacterium]|nr:cytochrome P460 family protein [Candidatus Poribacteria bacterium]